MTIAGFIKKSGKDALHRVRKFSDGEWDAAERVLTKSISDTVEEKILLLQNRKREIIQATIGGEEEFAAALNWDEIQELLA